jgi:hypothetical protein
VPRLRNALIHSFQSSVRMLPFQPGLQPNSQGSSRPAPPGFAIFKIHNTHGPNPASFKRLYRKRPGGRIHLLRRGLTRRVASDTALTFIRRDPVARSRAFSKR